jgi:hemerythrin-like domain-containing protein
MSTTLRNGRRDALVVTGGLLLTGVTRAAEPHEKAKGEEVTANEDLMREHGIIRRCLLVYRETCRRARRDPSSVPLVPLLRTAHLFREFAEDYHERALEEEHIFPVVRRLHWPVAGWPDILAEQHQRGREITDFALRAAARPSLPPAEAMALANALDALVTMYEPHAAREDTELFPAWKQSLGPKAYEEMGERFEDIEHRTFGGDGFDIALGRLVEIEREFGLTDLEAFTAPRPPGA